MPPYRGTGLAEASGLSLGYVSKLLDAMESQRLIRREGRTVVDVEWAGLLRQRAVAGADVLLLRSTGSIALRGRRLIDNVPHVAVSQLVLDCLGGPGRMPAEGNSILEYLKLDEESRWRRPNLQEWGKD